MGCCAGRPQSNKNLSADNLHDKTNNYDSSAMRNSYQIDDSMSQSRDFEVKELHRALNQKDICSIITYLDNDKKLRKNTMINHPWAQPPQSVGSLATAFLASFFMKNEDENFDLVQIDKYSVQLLNTEVAEMLKKNLKHEKSDRNELTVLLIMFMVDENVILQEHLLKKGIFNMLFQYLSKNNENGVERIINLRVATMTALKELYKNRLQYAEELCNEQSLFDIKDILQSNDETILFETLHCIDELATDQAAVTTNKRNQDILIKLADNNYIELMENIISRLKAKDSLEGSDSSTKEKMDARINSEKYAVWLKNNMNKAISKKIQKEN